MGYTLQAILGRSEKLDGASVEGTRVVPLLSGISMLPLGKAFLDAHGAPFLPLTDAGDSSLPSTIGEVCSQLAERGDVVYVEAEFHGGSGCRPPAPNNSLMLTRLAAEKAGCLARQLVREWMVACPSRRAA